MAANKLKFLYNLLYNHFGPQNWWPGDSPFEICIGAILTQNTAWTNVEKAIQNLKEVNLLELERMYNTSDSEIARLIKPAGYFNVKTKRLRNFLNATIHEFDSFFDLDKKTLREKLLNINGIGPETADSMLLYAFNKTSFVIDAYTKRILQRHSLASEDANYYQLKDYFESHLEEDRQLFNEYHALIVMLGKDYCKPKAKCELCPLKEFNGGPLI